MQRNANRNNSLSVSMKATINPHNYSNETSCTFPFPRVVTPRFKVVSGHLLTIRANTGRHMCYFWKRYDCMTGFNVCWFIGTCTSLIIHSWEVWIRAICRGGMSFCSHNGTLILFFFLCVCSCDSYKAALKV